MHPPAADSSSDAALKQQAAAGPGMTTLVDPLGGVPVYVMLPFNMVGADGQLSPTLTLKRNLEELKSVGVAGVVVEVWWGVVERKGPKKYDWSAYLQIVEMVKNARLRLKMVLSFHQCKIDDSINIPLPPWVVKEMEANQDMMYTDAEGRRNAEYISLGCDTKPVLQRRTPMQVYKDYMHGLQKKFHNYLGKDSVIVEIQVGMGPDGQLMYPSYSKANGWYFPGIGEFQCYDKYMKKSLKKAANAREKPEWAHVGVPTGASTYNEFPENTNFFQKDGEWKDEYGRFFLSWYSRKLLKHGDRLLAAAVYVFGESSNVTLSAKVPGIHWHYGTSSHAAEHMAGYYNTRQKEVDNALQKDVDNTQRRDRYLPIIKMLHKHGTMLNFSCVEMRDYEQPAQANSSPEALVKQVGEVAKEANVFLLGENALPRYDEYAFRQVVDTAARIGMSAFTYQRMSGEMFQPDNWRRFVEFVKDMSRISAKAP